jgi:hypothetical protein
MMDSLQLPQAMMARQGPNDYRFLGQSAGFLEAWRARAEELCRGFGTPLAGVNATGALFVHELDRDHVALVQVTHLGEANADPAVVLGFRLLVVTRTQYRALGGDPFTLAEACPPAWHLRGVLPEVVYQPATPVRTTEQVCAVLKRSDGPTLLGGVQAEIDGCRIVWIRQQPDAELLRSLWMLLPWSERCRLWPATFTFSNRLGFHALVTPQIEAEEYDGRYLSEQQADNYPEGRYELWVQSAAEAGDQAFLNQLFARRSQAEIWQLGWWLIGLLIVITSVMALLKHLAGN